MPSPPQFEQSDAKGRPQADQCGLELWGGFECTVVRLGDSYRDQFAETGHFDRIEDLEAIAGLGIRTLRYPVLWENVAPDDPETRDWSWHDERLGRLKDLGITPIVGLVHHGSGPRYTDLLDPLFAQGLARHAGAVAERYPWVKMFTPINEPLTTARFSGLYGHWYPHRRDDRSFLRMLVNQCRAVVLSMRAIRDVIPDARFVQTEDFGKIFAAPFLAEQAEFENHRRWLTWDLLCGRVDREHPLFGYLRANGIGPEELDAFVEEATVPDIVGVNHYLTSERYLDEDWGRYPEHFRGGNGRHVYADVEAVRVPFLDDAVGPLNRLREVWERYRLPMIVSEAHHGNTPDQQLRWLIEVWDAAQTLREEGADMRAVTMWSLMGVVDWNSLLIKRDGFYEPGAFDIRHTPPQLTVLGEAARELAASSRCDETGTARTGWWRHASRFYGHLVDTRRAG